MRRAPRALSRIADGGGEITLQPKRVYIPVCNQFLVEGLAKLHQHCGQIRPQVWNRTLAAASDPVIADSVSNRVFIATALPEKTEWRAAAAVAAVSMALFLAMVPYIRVVLPAVPAFIPAYQSALAVNDLVTAYLLFGQFAILRSRALLSLASGYLFTALLAVMHELSFPGAFTDSGWLGAGLQTTAWLYMSWHAGFPLFVIAYAVLKNGRRDRSFHAPGRAILGAVATVLALVVLVVAATTVGEPRLPALVVGPRYTAVMTGIVTAVWSLSFLALAMLASRRRYAVLDLWLMVVMGVWIFDVALSAVFDVARFDVGWYGGRLYGLVAASLVLAALLTNTNLLYARLAGLAQGLRRQAWGLAANLRAEAAALDRAEEQLRHAQKMEAIGNLTGGLAHDFNNLLGIVIGNLDLLKARLASEGEAHELLADALEASLKGADLTRRLLAFARRQPLQPERIEVNALVEGMARLLARTLGESIEVSLSLDPGLWPVVADPAQLESALANLATNARDAMPEGGKLIIATLNRTLDADYASLHADVTPGDYAMIEVTDTGGGMAPAVRARIFEPFFTTKPRGKGSGLGLAMIFGFMKQSKGHINVYSEEGKGTTFRLYLPREAGAGGAAQPAAVKAPESVAGKTVLAVEDNDALRRVTVRQLKELGYRVLEAANASQAMNVLEREAVDLLFTDVVMPGGSDGFDLARRALKRWPKLRALLASGFPEAKLNLLEKNGASIRLLNKPYRRDELAAAVVAALNGNGGR